MAKDLESFINSNFNGNMTIITKILNDSFLKGNHLNESIQAQLEMHLIIESELSQKRDKEVDELKSYIIEKMAKISALDSFLKQLSVSSLELGKVRETMINDSTEDGKTK
jgi:hypothetical protein